MSYQFSLSNTYGEPLGEIHDAEELSTFWRLCGSNCHFIATISQRYYTDYTYGMGELLLAERDLLALLRERLQRQRTKENYEELQLLYKLQAIVLMALRQECPLWGSGD